MEKGRLRKVIGLSLIAMMIVPFTWFLPLIVSTVQNLISPSPYTRIIVSGITQAQKIGNNYYSFGYPLHTQNQSQVRNFTVFKPGQSNLISFQATVGATY